MLRRSLLVVGLLVTIGVLVVATASAAGIYASFEEFPTGTADGNIVVPGVSFKDCVVYPGFFSWTGPGDMMALFNGGSGTVAAAGPAFAAALPGDCVMTFAAPQSSVSFDWASCRVPLTVTALLDGAEVFEQTYIGTFPPQFSSPEGYVSIATTFDQIVVSAECLAIDHLRTTEGDEPVAEGVPGCDALLAIPSTAVGATFVSNAEVYWQPGDLTNPLVTLEAGKNVRAIGVDATGEYTKILFVCDFLWVKSNTLGPNYESPWNGAALPTGVVN